MLADISEKKAYFIRPIKPWVKERALSLFFFWGGGGGGKGGYSNFLYYGTFSWQKTLSRPSLKIFYEELFLCPELFLGFRVVSQNQLPMQAKSLQDGRLTNFRVCLFPCGLILYVILVKIMHSVHGFRSWAILGFQQQK